MKQVNQRRIVPAGVLATVFFALLALVQVFVIAGGYDLESFTVKRVAPWAYEPFLKLVGEHPDTRPEWAAGQEKEGAGEEPIVTIGGFAPDEIPVSIEADPLPGTGTVIEPTVPVGEPTETVPESTPETLPPEKPAEVVPVG